MKVSIYQLLDPEARRNAIFMEPEAVIKKYQNDYKCIYTFLSKIKLNDDRAINNFLESIFIRYQEEKPKEYLGVSVSATDIVTIKGYGSYFCNHTVGWTKVHFRQSKKGLLIALEGIDGCGKSTVIESLEGLIHDPDILLVREPGSTKISEKIRNILLDVKHQEMDRWCEAYLYAASRAQLVHEVIKPALAMQKVVLVDRFIDSSLMYQGLGRDCSIREIKRLNRQAIDGCKPDLTILFDCPAKIALARRKGRKKDRIESEDVEFFEKIREGYLSLAKANRYHTIVIDATQDPEIIKQEVQHILENLI